MQDNQPDELWTIVELARYMRYAPTTIYTLLSRSPEKLPPRVGPLGSPRWVPDLARKWCREQTVVIGAPRRGRPRLTRAS